MTPTYAHVTNLFEKHVLQFCPRIPSQLLPVMSNKMRDQNWQKVHLTFHRFGISLYTCMKQTLKMSVRKIEWQIFHLSFYFWT